MSATMTWRQPRAVSRAGASCPALASAGPAGLPPGLCQLLGRREGRRQQGNRHALWDMHGPRRASGSNGSSDALRKNGRTVTGGPMRPADSVSPAWRAVRGGSSSPKASMGKGSAFGVLSSELVPLQSPRNRRSNCVIKPATRTSLFLFRVVRPGRAGPWLRSGPSCRPPGAPPV